MQHVVATGVLTGATASERGIDLAHIANISDGNALTHHLLEIVLCHLQRTRVGRQKGVSRHRIYPAVQLTSIHLA